jgi:hypothetical protein
LTVTRLTSHYYKYSSEPERAYINHKTPIFFLLNKVSLALVLIFWIIYEKSFFYSSQIVTVIIIHARSVNGKKNIKQKNLKAGIIINKNFLSSSEGKVYPEDV